MLSLYGFFIIYGRNSALGSTVLSFRAWFIKLTTFGLCVCIHSITLIILVIYINNMVSRPYQKRSYNTPHMEQFYQRVSKTLPTVKVNSCKNT